MLNIALKIDTSKLSNPEADIRYKLPEHIQYLSEGELRDDGYDYAKDGQLLLFLVGEDHFRVETFLKKLFQMPFEGNDLSLTTVVGVDHGDGFQPVYPSGYEGDFKVD